MTFFHLKILQLAMDAANKTVELWTAVEVSEWLTSMGSPYRDYAKAFLGEYNPYLVVLVY